MTSHAIDAHQDTRTGMLLMVTAMLFIPTMDAIAKILGETLPVLEITLARFLGQAAFPMLVFMLLSRPARLIPHRLGMHVLRGCILAIANVLFFSALTVMPLADALTIFFVEPMILTLLSAVVLKEAVGPRRWVAIFVGFIGAMLVIRPSFQNFGAAALMPFASAFLFSIYVLMTRMLTGTGAPLVMHCAAGLGGGFALILAIVFGSALGFEKAMLVAPNPQEWLLLVGIGFIGFLAHYMVMLAFQKAPVSVLAPISYLEIVSATILGLLLFSDFPDALTWLGIVIIVMSGLYIMHRERLKGLEDEKVNRT